MIKIADNGEFEGYAVVFTDAMNPDLHGDFFTAKTNFGPLDGQTVMMYHHGASDALQRVLIGTATLTKDDTGLYAKGMIGVLDPDLFEKEELDRAKEYASRLIRMGKAGKMKFSTGAVPQTVVREQTPEGTWFIKQWVPGELSLTPTPAEPKTQAAFKAEQKAGAMFSKKNKESIQKAIDNMELSAKDLKDLIAEAEELIDEAEDQEKTDLRLKIAELEKENETLKTAYKKLIIGS